MMYLFQRVVPNEFGWIYPSPGRLKDPDSNESYLDYTGFGHEDWNFNKDFAMNGWIYGYMYYQPPRPADEYNIAFASYDRGLGWYLAGFYLDAEYVPSGAATNSKILAEKAKHLHILEQENSLGTRYNNLTNAELIARLRDDLADYRWRVRPENLTAITPPVRIPEQVFNSQAFHYRRPQFLTQQQFDALRRLGRATNDRRLVSPPGMDSDYFEGDGFETLHKRRERSRELVRAAKSRFLRLHGKLFCEACGFDFEDHYGARGRGFIEAHHIKEHSRMRGVPASQ